MGMFVVESGCDLAGDARCESHDCPQGPESFKGSQSGPQGRALRQAATGPYAARRAKGSGLSFFSEDSHNLILDTQGLSGD
eukprot:333014-Prymnesium_polylepis.1